jgi:hypothetical protein
VFNADSNDMRNYPIVDRTAAENAARAEGFRVEHVTDQAVARYATHAFGTVCVQCRPGP